MFAQDLILILQWWIAWAAFGVVGWGWIRNRLGYSFAKATGIALVSLVVWLLAIFKIVPFGIYSIYGVSAVVGIVGWLLPGKRVEIKWKQVFWSELIFGGALILWSWVKAHEPSINGLEKFMDYGFTKSILESRYFPPADMWFAGKSINYYYFGHLIMAVVTLISKVDLAYGFNLMLATIFALCLTMSGAIAARILPGRLGAKKWLGVGLTAFLVTLSGNLQTIYAFTSGYSGDVPTPFWQIMKWGQWSTYWYPNATRFIPYTIHEFPAYSFVVSDMHGHVLDIPLVLLAIAILIEMWNASQIEKKMLVGYGILVGILMMTNALDGPIYLGLFGWLAICKDWPKSLSREWLYGYLVKLLIVMGAFGLTIMPFLINFESFVSGVAVNCPPAALAGKKFGPIIFETVDKCQKSPIWMMLLLWGLFVYTGLWNWFAKDGDEKTANLIRVISVFCLGLIIFPEFFYFKDIYPLHFRSNTMFKLGYQVFIFMSLASGYVITTTKNKFFKIGVIPLLFLVSIYPSFAVKSYFGGLKDYHGLYGLEWLDTRYPEDKKVIEYLDLTYKPGEMPTILEASGDSYTDANRISAFSGASTVAGWLVHEWLWRGGYEPISKRVEEVRSVYETHDEFLAWEILKKYHVNLVIVGMGEKTKYPDMDEKKFEKMGRIVFSYNGTKVYQLRNQ